MVKSYRGKDIDMVSLSKKNEMVVALGNSGMNARGDILGNGGKIIETSEERIEKLSKMMTTQTQTVPMKPPVDDVKVTPEPTDTFVETIEEVKSKNTPNKSKNTPNKKGE